QRGLAAFGGLHLEVVLAPPTRPGECATCEIHADFPREAALPLTPGIVYGAVEACCAGGALPVLVLDAAAAVLRVAGVQSRGPVEALNGRSLGHVLAGLVAAHFEVWRLLTGEEIVDWRDVDRGGAA